MIKTLRNSAAESAYLAFIVVVFVLGGTSRADLTSVPLLRLVSCVALALVLVTTPRSAWKENRALLGLAFGWVLLTALHLLPLPPSVWHSLPSRELLVAIDRATALTDMWRPLSVVPWRTVDALFALAAPLAALIFTIRLPARAAMWLVYVLLGLVLASALLGLLQVIGGPGNVFYTYRITNADSAVGLFANRNHNAVFLAMGFPLIAAALSLTPAVTENIRLREWAGAGVAVLLIPFILTTQSRAGILICLVAMGLGFWTYRSPAQSAQPRRPRKRIDPRLAFGLLAGVGMIALTMVFTATNAIQRLGRIGQEDNELRLQIWPPIWRLARDYMPFGSGMGTFAEVYQSIEPAELLTPRYVNQAHNDWLEVLLVGGLPAAAVVVAGSILAIRAALAANGSVSSPDNALRRLGASVCLVLALASLYDYPIRTPALGALLSIGAALLLRKRPAT